jgi:hypothetical protein
MVIGSILVLMFDAIQLESKHWEHSHGDVRCNTYRFHTLGAPHVMQMLMQDNEVDSEKC